MKLRTPHPIQQNHPYYSQSEPNHPPRPHMLPQNQCRGHRRHQRFQSHQHRRIPSRANRIAVNLQSLPDSENRHPKHARIDKVTTSRCWPRQPRPRHQQTKRRQPVPQRHNSAARHIRFDDLVRGIHPSPNQVHAQQDDQMRQPHSPLMNVFHTPTQVRFEC